MAQPQKESEGTPQPAFELFEWLPAYTSCQKHFLDHAQYDPNVQAAAAFTNIRLPHQWPKPVYGSGNARAPTRMQASQSGSGSSSQAQDAPQLSSPSSSAGGGTTGSLSVSLYPYIRRLVVTGFDKPAVLQGFFGDGWHEGIGPLHESERRNYMFLAKSGGWAKAKTHYDISPQETVPFLQPLQNVTLKEIETSEREWSRWLAMEDWMVGPRAPSASSVRTEHAGHHSRDEEMDYTVGGRS